MMWVILFDPLHFKFVYVKTDLAHTVDVWENGSPIVILFAKVSVPVIVKGRLIVWTCHL